MRQKYRAKKLERYHGRLVNLLTNRRQLALGAAAQPQEPEVERGGKPEEPPEAEQPAAGNDAEPGEGEARGGETAGIGGNGEEQP